MHCFDTDYALVMAAADYAAEAHKGQLRKYTGRAFISHPTRVAGRLLLLGAKAEWVAAGFLHDTIEDCQGRVTYQTIRAKFGTEIADLVKGLTNPSKEHPELTRAARKAMDCAHIRSAERPVRIIKLIDRTDNIRELHLAPLAFRELYYNESKLLLSALVGTSDELEAELEHELIQLKHSLISEQGK